MRDNTSYWLVNNETQLYCLIILGLLEILCQNDQVRADTLANMVN